MFLRQFNYRENKKFQIKINKKKDDDKLGNEICVFLYYHS